MNAFLFFSTEAGLAHVTRSLAIAKELKNRGARVLFAVGKEKHDKDYNVSIQTFTQLLPKRSGVLLAADAIEKIGYR